MTEDGEGAYGGLDGADREDTGRADRSGLYLMERGDLEAAVGGATPHGTDDDWEDEDGATSREDAVRRRQLARYRDDPDLLWRPHLVADDGMLARLGRLAAGSPNIARAAEVVRRAAVLSRHGQTPLQVPPVILVGPPGCGKTRYATALAQALGTTSTVTVGSTITDMGKLIGYHPSWKGAGPGLVAKALLGCTTASPVVVIDEAEKISAVDGLSCPLDALLTAMEPSTARSYRDGYYDIPMRAENVIWLLCTNDIIGLSGPLLDRCIVIDVAALSGAERHRALDDLTADVVLDHGVVPMPLDAETLVLLDGVGLRRARAVVSAALAGALEAGRDTLVADDIRAAVALLDGATRRPRRPAVGFIRF